MLIKKEDFKENNLLEHLLKKNIPVEYQCKEGYCGACRCKLISGSIKKNKNTIAFVNKDEILLCSSKPKSDINIQLFN